MAAHDVFSQTIAKLFRAQTEPPASQTAETERYTQLMALARALVGKLTAQREEITRLEALAEGRTQPKTLKAAMFLGMLLVIAIFGLMTIAAGPPPISQGPMPLGLTLLGLTAQVFWCGATSGKAWRRLKRAKGWALLKEPALVLFLIGQTGLVMLAAQTLMPWPVAMFLAICFVISVIAGYAGTSGDLGADRIFGELVAARLAARATEEELSRLENAVRTAQSADIATLSRVAPWPAQSGAFGHRPPSQTDFGDGLNVETEHG